MAHQGREQGSVAKRAAWIGGAILVLLVIAFLAWALLLRRHPQPTSEPSPSAQLHPIVPTATATSTPMPVPTPTRTSYPSHTPELTPTATETPTPTVPPGTATPLPSPTSGRTSTPSSTPSRTAIPPTPTPSPVPCTPSPTPSATAAYACPVLIEPQEGSSHTGTVTFRWQSAGTLQPGDVYDVRAWRGDEELGIGRTTETQFTVGDPSLVRGPGQYRWRVVVIRIVGSDPNKDWQIVSPLPDPRTFSWGQRPEPTPTSDGG